MTDRITTTCQHSHTVTLDEGWRMTTGGEIEELDGYGWGLMPMRGAPLAIRAELEAALAAAEAACGGCVAGHKRCVLTMPAVERDNFDMSEVYDDES